MSGLAIFPGGWPTLEDGATHHAADRFEADAADELYEGALRRCRSEGHGRLFAFFVDDLEVLICGRCLTKFKEVPE